MTGNKFASNSTVSTQSDVIGVAYKSSKTDASPFSDILMGTTFSRNVLYVEYELGAVYVRAASSSNIALVTDLLATLSNGGSYTDATLDGVTVTVKSMDAS
jgi:hypothetical protein